MYVSALYPLAMYGLGFAIASLGGYLKARQLKRKANRFASLVEPAWVVIANVSGGDWNKQPDEWRDAAEKWRDDYHDKFFID